MPIRSAGSSWSLSARRRSVRALRCASPQPSTSGRKARPASTSKAPPAGFPPGGWGFGMEPVARCGSRMCHERVKKVELELQLIGAALRSIADEMGAVLIRSAFSANINRAGVDVVDADQAAPLGDHAEAHAVGLLTRVGAVA